MHPGSLSAQVRNGLVQRTGIDPGIVDDVIWGCVTQANDQSMDIARTAVLAAGWPESVAGVTVDRRCGSSQQSIHFAVAGVVAGHYDVVVAGGVESIDHDALPHARQGNSVRSADDAGGWRPGQRHDH
ncbi:hypothetical protein OQ789_11695 [Mycobacterium sp. 94-17]|nr:hypothetical protein [Mycobacterium sp. 94-17]MEB4209721.1 hypothetical protein [Mycobacterium sp. 94-17]